MSNNAVMERFIAESLAGKSPNTVKAYRQSIAKFADYLADSGADLTTFARSDVQFYIQRLETVEKRKPSGVNRELAAIKAFCRWANKEDAVKDLRVVKPAKPTAKAPEWLDRTTRNRLIRETDRKRNKRDHAMVMTLLGCGLRVSELVTLDRDDVTISERKGTLHVRNGKGGKERYVPIPADTRRAISEYLAQRTDNHDALFLSQYGKRISVRTVQAMLANYGVHPHQLRHTYVKTLVDRGVPAATIMALTGHTSADMVAWYSQPSEDEKAAIVEGMFA
ncbi:tyrosine-type recombinase/integrase [Fervidibacillus halotolerans]|uniref:Tyrosine-type recombinase/integrase n=1 Tax=Fervidibacillus halotolerans TaxID=2980027 RepID=A0A9E8M2U1_9BACI|nr:tyrosine-type recombinase/integrase [Fervidibacillus halotolerans]WAA13389.1 tyrosine-type recombinase/integrase [Fervidibacillus halotolerans]